MIAGPLDLTTLELTIDGVRGAHIPITSANPVNFHHAIRDPTGADAVTIDSLAFIRSGAPLVIVVPGSAGVGPNHLAHVHTLVGAGYSSCVIDPFGGRSVTSTVANQAQYSFAASAFDVLATLRTLVARTDVDPTRVAAQGHSRGGAAVIMAAARQLADAVVGPELAFAGVYAAYPWCGQQFERPSFGSTAVRAIVGDIDDWLSVVHVQAQIASMRAAHVNASMRIVRGAGHSFDRDTELAEVTDARVSPHAPIEYLADDGSMIDPYTGVADPARVDRDQFVDARRNGFGRLGAHMGSADPSQPALFRDDMLAFYRSTFGG